MAEALASGPVSPSGRVSRMPSRPSARSRGPIMTFKDFMGRYLDRHDTLLSHLAGDIYDDSTFPDVGRNGREKLMDYLEACNACPKAIALARQAWGLYLRALRLPAPAEEAEPVARKVRVDSKAQSRNI
jgi:uncharacterized protein YozE (UPF0346 family)